MLKAAACPLAATMLLATGCARSGGVSEDPRGSRGPPRVRSEQVDLHAEYFDENLVERSPGSRGELVAASYILAHLQKAGYAPLLDPVPVGDLVRSTNVTAAPPAGGSPAFVVTTAYDSADGKMRGAGLGLFLELARALTVAEPEHRVEFVALGAESEDGKGSRLLASSLDEREVEAQVIELGDISRAGATFDARGPAARSLLADHDGTGSAIGASDGLKETTVSGSAEHVARVLLDWLLRAGG